ncbi:CPBP family intramembrane glutamic endopeptidase [Nocardioides acrostichi]|uniref:CPBP family intramembrane metalloprotease n=1 Tax=Nocardioides acrostichi TaxID=2784339 RepID=A0A930YBE5_9ACTN|nr:type II CAAX endopeptidase family protein [Nocardioides acrostichi]MBF4160404.1 CPBP family intramembrane metalloprotease [Nocardioides acrostichi]
MTQVPPETTAKARPYHQQFAFGRQPDWAWVLLGVVALLVSVFVLQVAVSIPVAAVLLALGTPLSGLADKLGGDPVTPSFLALVNLGWAVMIPAVIGVGRLVNGMRAGWLVSVTGRFRVRWFLTCLGLALVALVATLVVGALVPEQGDGVAMSGAVNSFTSTTRDFLLVVVLLTPLQAAGEEFVFRGYLTQGIGSAFARWPRVSAVVAVVVPAFVFALAHGIGQDLPVFVDRFAFGLVAGTLVLATGGLEAGIAMHVLNNFVAFGLALTFGDMTSALNPTGGSWWSLPTTLTQSLVYLLLAIAIGRRRGLARAGAPSVLAGCAGRV